MSEHKQISVELTATNKITCDEPRTWISGWEEGSSRIEAVGEIAEILIKKDGETMFGLHIRPDGSVIFTSYNMFFVKDVERHVRLRNERPWE